MIFALGQDFRFALRALRKSPGFTLAAILLLAIGIGGTTVVFSAVDSLLLRPLPVSHPEELARPVILLPNQPPQPEQSGADEIEKWLRLSKSFSSGFGQTDAEVAFSDGATSRRVQAEVVTGGYFSVLDTPPAIGRVLSKEDEWGEQGQIPAVLSYDFWTRHFHGDPRVLGRVIQLEKYPFVVVGVTAKAFHGISIDSGPDLRVPLFAWQFITAAGRRSKDKRGCCGLQIAGRLRPGVTPAAAKDETLASLEAAVDPSPSYRFTFESQKRTVQGIERGTSLVRDRFSSGLGAVLGAIGLLLLLACANVAGLLLARVAAREAETALRLALGASRGQLARHCLMESSLLTVFGGGLGLLIAWISIPLLSRITPPIRDLTTLQVPVKLPTTLDLRVFGFALAVSVIAALLVGLSPAWRASRTDLMASIRSGGADRKSARLRAVVVAAQVAVCTVVLANAGLMVETLRQFYRMDKGFDPDHVITFTLYPSESNYSKEEGVQRHNLAVRLLRDTQNLPGVSSAAMAIRPLMRGAGVGSWVGPPGTRIPPHTGLNTSLNGVTPEYFTAMGMRLIAGRLFDERDGDETGPHPAVINQAFARKFFPGMNAIGQRFGNGGGGVVIKPEFEVVGIVADARYRSLREPIVSTYFSCSCGSHLMEGFDFLNIEVRTRGNPASLIPAVEDALRRADPSMQFREIHTLTDEVDASLWPERIMAGLGSGFSALAALLAGIGLYGLLSYMIGQRSREIGIRMALGATPRDIVKVTTAPTLVFVAIGVLGGVGISFATGQLLRNLLYGVSPRDLWANLSGLAIVILTAILASILPALRAVRVNPSTALRDRA